MRLRMTPWKLAETERELFATVDSVPNWKLADKARRMLFDMTHRLSNDMNVPELDDSATIPSRQVRQIAVVALSGIVIRSVGSTMSLIACGYIPESSGPARRALEAQHRARAVVDDTSGQHARDWLSRPMGGMKRLAAKYNSEADIELLSVFAHADAVGLNALRTRPLPVNEAVGELEVDLRPSRNNTLAAVMLYSGAYEAVGQCAILAEAFKVGFEIPPWVSSQLKQCREVVKRLASEQERANRSIG